MALPGAAQCGRNPAHRALAGDGAGGADDCGDSLLSWMEPVRGFAYSRWLYWLLTVYLVHAVVVMLLVRFRPQSTSAFRLVVHAVDILWPVLISLFATAQRGPFFLFFVFVHGGSSLSLGAVGDGGHGGYGGGTAVECEAFAVRAGLEPAADRWLHLAHLPRLGVSVAGTGSAAAVHEFGVSDCARILAGLHVGEPEESAGGARRDHARSQFDAGGGGTDRDHAADSWGGDEHLRRAPGAERLAGERTVTGYFWRR